MQEAEGPGHTSAYNFVGGLSIPLGAGSTELGRDSDALSPGTLLTARLATNNTYDNLRRELRSKRSPSALRKRRFARMRQVVPN